ncbi:MAG: pantoate--beta-alanine ligase [Gammaproteobacteria bacterium]|nr:pantoate--beta-alanine ligase [Gammaproteobacteria bacterium]MCB1923976.1 pantoate--beta-alanine ligase [Gammaproteobacteria bacterium]
MITLSDLSALRTQIESWRRGGNVAFVPTMGNLHEGHLALVRAARKLADRVVVSIFVNPLQFGAGEDFDNYPRTMERDSSMLEGEGTDLLFAPSVAVMYPKPQEQQTRVEVPGLSSLLCGACRPGHFVGVSTVVCKLFNMVQPDIAVFGKKDFQQLMVIRRMVDDLAMPVRVVGAETVREADGLAMSSRNGYLSPDERRTAPILYRVLSGVATRLREGSDDYEGLQVQAARELEESGFTPDYVAIRRASDLQEPEADEKDLVVLAAANLGKARLIDNIDLSR